MSDSLVWRLIAKDLYLYRWLILGALVAGGVSFFLGRDVESLGLGTILFITSVVALGIFVVMYGVLKERQDKSLLFVLSLPISPLQYGIAKVFAALIAFGGPWLLALAISTWRLSISESAGGQIPFSTALMGLFLCNFCVLLATVIITMSEVWAVAGILITNMSISVYIPYVSSLPGIEAYRNGAVPVWSSTAIALIGVELAISVAAVATALIVHSRKRDFI